MIPTTFLGIQGPKNVEAGESKDFLRSYIPSRVFGRIPPATLRSRIWPYASHSNISAPKRALPLMAKMLLNVIIKIARKLEFGRKEARIAYKIVRKSLHFFLK